MVHQPLLGDAAVADRGDLLKGRFSTKNLEGLGCQVLECLGFWVQAFGRSWVSAEEMLKQHAAQRKIRKQTPLWIDAFATCLHDPMQVFPSPKDLEQAPFCKVLLSPRCEGTLLLLDSTGAALERTWCLLEVTLTLDLPKERGKLKCFWQILRSLNPELTLNS